MDEKKPATRVEKEPIERLHDSFVNKVRQLYGKKPEVCAVMFGFTDDDGEQVAGRLVFGGLEQVAALIGSVLGVTLDPESDPTAFFQTMATYCAAQRGEIELVDDIASADGSAEITDEEIERVKAILSKMKEEEDGPVEDTDE